MKSVSLILFLLILSIPQFTLAADEVKTPAADAAKTPGKASAIAAEVKLGSVDLSQVAEKSDVGVKAMATLKSMYEKFQSSMKKKEEELEKLKGALQSKELTPDKRAAKEKQFQKKFGEYQKFAKNSQQEFMKKQGELGKQIKDDLEKIVKDYGREHGYAVILNKEGLVYNDGKYEIRDLTEEILKLANSGGKK